MVLVIMTCCAGRSIGSQSRFSAFGGVPTGTPSSPDDFWVVSSTGFGLRGGRVDAAGTADGTADGTAAGTAAGLDGMIDLDSDSAVPMRPSLSLFLLSRVDIEARRVNEPSSDQPPIGLR